MLSIETVTHQCSEKCYRSAFGVPSCSLPRNCCCPRRHCDSVVARLRRRLWCGSRIPNPLGGPRKTLCSGETPGAYPGRRGLFTVHPEG